LQVGKGTEAGLFGRFDGVAKKGSEFVGEGRGGGGGRGLSMGRGGGLGGGGGGGGDGKCAETQGDDRGVKAMFGQQVGGRGGGGTAGTFFLALGPLRHGCGVVVCR